MSKNFYVVGVTCFFAGANMRVLDPLLAVIGNDFGTVATDAAVAVTSFSISYGLFQFVYGPLSERLGKIEVMLGASVLAALMSLICSRADSLLELTFLRFLTGAGVGGLIPLGLAWVSDNTQVNERQTGLARLIAFVMLGTIFGPASSGIISDYFGWRLVFEMYCYFFIFNAMLLLNVIRKKSISQGKGFDREVWSFFKQINLLRDRWVRSVLLTVFIEGALFHGCHTFVGTFLQEKFGISISLAGLMVAGFGIGAILYTFCVRYLVNSLGQTGLVLWGGIVLFVSYLIMPLVPRWYFCSLVIVISGFGFFMFHNTLQTCSSEMFPKYRGIALCLHGFCMLAGTAFGVTISAFLISYFSFTVSYFFSAVGLLVLAIVFQRILRQRLTNC